MVTQLETWRSAEKQELWLRAIEGNNFPLTNLAVLLYKANSCINVWKLLWVSNKWKRGGQKKRRCIFRIRNYAILNVGLLELREHYSWEKECCQTSPELRKKHQNSSFDCRCGNEEYNFHIFCITTLFKVFIFIQYFASYSTAGALVVITV